MRFKEVIEVLDGEIISGTDAPDIEIQCVASTDLLSDLLHSTKKANAVLITGLTNSQVIRAAEIADIKAIIFVFDKMPDRDTVQLAQKKGIPLVVTGLSKFTSCGRLYSIGLRSCAEDKRRQR